MLSADIAAIWRYSQRQLDRCSQPQCVAIARVIEPKLHFPSFFVEILAAAQLQHFCKHRRSWQLAFQVDPMPAMPAFLVQSA